MTDKCKDCAAFRRDARGKGQHECRLMPPQILLLGMGQGPLGQPSPVIASAWPTVREDNECVRWTPKRTEGKVMLGFDPPYQVG